MPTITLWMLFHICRQLNLYTSVSFPTAILKIWKREKQIKNKISLDASKNISIVRCFIILLFIIKSCQSQIIQKTFFFRLRMKIINLKIKIHSLRLNFVCIHKLHNVTLSQLTVGKEYTSWITCDNCGLKNDDKEIKIQKSNINEFCYKQY